MTRTLQYAGLRYFDRALDRLDEQDSTTDLRIDYVDFSEALDLFRRQAQGAEFESSEMSLATFIILTSRPDCEFVGIPVFTSRSFRHNCLYVNSDSGISGPADLRGARVGVPEYQMTAAVWVRGFLSDDYGVTPGEMDWYTGGLEQPGYRARYGVDLPADVRLSRIPEETALVPMLARGDLDALVSVLPPSVAEPTVRRLFPDSGPVERDYYRRTRIFPIMHLVVLRRDVYEKDRTLAADLATAFAEAKEIGRRRLRRLDSLAVELPWLNEALAEVDELFAGDAFPYGVEANLETLRAATSYCYEQGLSSRRVEPEELFAPEAVRVLG
ncbi:MAG: hypothetical protein J2P24_04965 [Streptosporangiales bacterium]|nr:hypothetical protein [Streptosporangiales bacterium]MBO0890289.1 hypothetical protein [Acidothermales bacterium]